MVAKIHQITTCSSQDTKSHNILQPSGGEIRVAEDADGFDQANILAVPRPRSGNGEARRTPRAPATTEPGTGMR